MGLKKIFSKKSGMREAVLFSFLRGCSVLRFLFALFACFALVGFVGVRVCFGLARWCPCGVPVLGLLVLGLVLLFVPVWVGLLVGLVAWFVAC